MGAIFLLALRFVMAAIAIHEVMCMMCDDSELPPISRLVFDSISHQYIPI